MDLAILSDDYTFHLEKGGKRLRLVVSKDGVENVCRLEPAQNLRNFIQNGDSHMFKGRLKLQANGGWVNVIVKAQWWEKLGEKCRRRWWSGGNDGR